MNTVYILIGVPGSGKSTWAQQRFADTSSCIIISTDAIRGEIIGDPGSQDRNNEVFEIAYDRLRCTVHRGQDVCFDATNITQESRKRIMNIAKESNPGVVFVAVTFPITIEEAINRQKLRDRKVPSEVIESFAKRYEHPSIEEGFTFIL